MRVIKRVVVDIMGTVWHARLMDRKSFVEAHGRDYERTEAVCVGSDRTMDFVVDYIDIGVARHEVRHAFTFECCITSSKLNALQMEELQCELDESRWDDMNSRSKQIWSAFKKCKKPSART